MFQKEYWLLQTKRNNLFCLVICGAVAMIEGLLMLLYAVSQQPDSPALPSTYFIYYLTAIIGCTAFASLLYVFRNTTLTLSILHITFIPFLLLWAALFAAYDAASGGSGYVLIHILILTSAGVRIPTRVHCSINAAAFLLFVWSLWHTNVNEKGFYDLFINMLIMVILSFVILLYSNKRHFDFFMVNQQICCQNERLTHYAEYDDLTGLYNRRLICQYLGEMLCTRDSVCCVMLDVDDFKAYNDAFGHPQGDRLLQAISDVMAAGAAASGGRAGRYGGEEFMLVLPELSVFQAKAVMDSILNRIAAVPMEHGTTASAGGCMSEPGMDFDAIVLCADKALYHVKLSGKNRFDLYGRF